MKKKRLFAFGTILVLVLSVFATTFVTPMAQAAACPQKPYMTITPTFDVTGTYSIWAQEKRASGATTKVLISVDNGANCDEFDTANVADSWEWVQGTGGRLEKRIEAGTPSIRLYASGGTVALANILFTLDDSCVPTVDGTNCVQKPLDLNITGIRQSEVISGDVVVETLIGNLTTESVRVEYYFNNANQPYSTTTTSPYCLVLTNGACAAWPSSSLGNGQYRLTVKAVTESGPTEQTISFTVNNKTSNPAPNPTPPAPTPTPTTPTTPPTSPTSRPSTTPSRNTSLSQVGPSEQSTVVQAIKQNSSPSSNTNTRGVIQQISNMSAPVGSGFVAGLSLEGQLKGKVVVSAPKNLVFYPGDKVELLAGGKVIETKNITQQNAPVSFILDTTKLANGKTIVSLRVTKATGEISTYSSNVEIANGTLATGIGSVKSKWPAILMMISLFIALIVGAFFFIRWYRTRQEYNMMHNTLDYSYVQPENPYMAPAGAAMAVFVGFSAVLFIGGNQSYAANIGYIISTTQAKQIAGFPAEFSLENDPASDIDFVRMSDSDDGSPDPGENSDTGHNHGGNPTTPPTTPPTPPATSADYQSNLNMLLATSSRNRRFDDAARARTPSAALTNDPALYGDPDEYSGHGAYNPDTIGANAIMFRTECSFSHFSYDDAIVYPNQPGAAHLHVNFGNTHNNAYTTYDTLINSGNGTCSGMELNRTAYWVPALIDPQGFARVPIRALIYYKSIGPIVGKNIPYPEGLRFLINTSITTEQAEAPPWNCNYGPPEASVTTNCPNNWLHQIIAFPRCLKENVDVTAYATSWVNSMGGWWYSDCPPGSLALPQLEYNIFYPVEGGEDSSTWFLSSDVDRATKQQTAANGSSSHGDWFGGWNKEVNRLFLERCNNNTVVSVNGGDCGFGSLIPCISANSSLNCNQYAPNMQRIALKAIEPDPGYYKVPVAQLHREICPQAPIPDGSPWSHYAYCVNPR